MTNAPSWIRGVGHRPIVLVALILLLSALLRFFHLGNQPLWLDEALTWLYAGEGFDLISSQDVHPPLYYSIIRLWMHGSPGFGIPALASQDNEFFLRAPSALLGVLTVPLVYALGRTIGGVRMGLLGALLFAIAPFQVLYGQEARMYTLLSFLGVLAMWGVASVLASFSPDSVRVSKTEAKPGASLPGFLAWPAFVLGSVGALYTHNTSILLLVSCSLVLFVCLATDRLHRKQFLRNWFLAIGAIILCWSLWLPQIIAQARGVLDSYWIPNQSVRRIIQTLGTLYVPVDNPSFLYAATALLLIALGMLGLFHLRRSQWGIFLLILPTAPIVGVILVGLVRSILIPRILIWTTIPFYLTIGAGILCLKQRWLRGLVLCLVVGLHLWGLMDYYTSYRKEAWDRAARYVAGRVAEGDLILIFEGSVKEPFNYYFRKHEKDVPQVPLWGGPVEIEAQMRALPPHVRFWLVVSHVREQELREVLAVLVKRGVFRKAKPFKGLSVLLFDAS